MKLDILIKNGHVVDTYSNIDCIKAIGIIDDKIVEVVDDNIQAETVVDAEGCYVLPGLVDFHSHIFYGGSEWAINPDWLLADGITAVVDGGTSGNANYEAFRKSVITQSKMHIKSYISINSGGLIAKKLHQDYNPELFNIKSIKQLKSKYKDEILGLKIMISKNIIGENALDVLKKTVELADSIGDLSVCVHTTNPGANAEEIADVLRPGDIYCHCYHGSGQTIINEHGKIKESILSARKRGVIFDAANGGGHFCNGIAQKAISQGFLPDVISGDENTSCYNVSNRMKSLPFVMSRYLSLGISLKDIVKATTEVPAKLMNMEGQIGTLKNGAYADISIFKLKSQKVKHLDFKFEEYYGNYLFVPQMTISNGEIAFNQIDFNI